MLNIPQNQRFNQPVLGEGGKNESTLTKGISRGKTRLSKDWKNRAEKANSPPSQGRAGNFRTANLLSLDGAGGAGALASAAVDAGAGVDLHMIVAHGDRAHGAGTLASAAGDARVSDLTSHVLHLQQMMCFEPVSIVPHSAEIAT